MDPASGGYVIIDWLGDWDGDPGSGWSVAGVSNEDGNVVGMMPHPERAVESEINPIDNKPSSLIFESLLVKMGVKN